MKKEKSKSHKNKILAILFIAVWIWVSAVWQQERAPSASSGEAADSMAESVSVKVKNSQTVESQRIKKRSKIQAKPALIHAVLTTAPEESAVGVPVQNSPTPGPLAPNPPGLNKVRFEVKEQSLAVAFGDMILGKVPEGFKGKIAVTDAKDTKLWPGANIPYQIAKDLPPAQVQVVNAAIEYFYQNTPIRFIRAEATDRDFLVFTPAKDLCASYVGRIGGGQAIYVSKRCGRQQVIHEIMHALGFVHEQSRVDRDQYIKINWSNIEPVFWLQFWKIPDSWADLYQGAVFDFDPLSAMLYKSTAFARDTKVKTIVPLNSFVLQPTEKGLSRTDRERLEYLYR